MLLKVKSKTITGKEVQTLLIKDSIYLLIFFYERRDLVKGEKKGPNKKGLTEQSKRSSKIMRCVFKFPC